MEGNSVKICSTGDRNDTWLRLWNRNHYSAVCTCLCLYLHHHCVWSQNATPAQEISLWQIWKAIFTQLYKTNFHPQSCYSLIEFIFEFYSSNIIQGCILGFIHRHNAFRLPGRWSEYWLLRQPVFVWRQTGVQIRADMRYIEVSRITKPTSSS